MSSPTDTKPTIPADTTTTYRVLPPRKHSAWRTAAARGGQRVAGALTALVALAIAVAAIGFGIALILTVLAFAIATFAVLAAVTMIRRAIRPNAPRPARPSVDWQRIIIASRQPRG